MKFKLQHFACYKSKSEGDWNCCLEIENMKSFFGVLFEKIFIIWSSSTKKNPGSVEQNRGLTFIVNLIVDSQEFTEF